MPDEDLAALIQGETSAEKKSEKMCPYCKSNILLRAQRCKYCNGDVTPAILQGNNWKTEQASDGQLSILRKLKIKAPGSLSKGQAAGLIANVKENNPASFSGITGSRPARKKSGGGCGLMIILFILLLATIIGALKYFDKLDETTALAKRLIYQVKGKMNQTDTLSETPQPTLNQTLGTPVTTRSVNSSSPQTSIAPETTPRSAGSIATPMRPATSTENALATKFRNEFEAPKIGSKIILALKNGKVMRDILMELDNSGLMLKRGSASIRVDRKQLADQARASLYEDDYVSFRLKLHERYLAQKKTEGSIAEKYRTEENARNARARKFREETAGHTTGPTTSKRGAYRRPTTSIKATGETRQDNRAVASGKMSMKEWMAKYNQNNARLLARQQRVRKHEKKVQEEGLEQ
ncbi:MAG: hypothetical protein KAH23_09275 [Kiritimatiellae bacterium]|nr:hypothetical protein [Kiritimatiellia bacterium]